MIRVVALCVLVLAGCLRADLVDCGDGRVCPGGSVCAAGSCVGPDDLAACQDLAEGAACQSASVPAGTCVDGACIEHRCGNGTIDPGSGEGCDDGNTASGDGCSSSCLREVCGNGSPDLGELCDDGNTSSADGCSSTCQREEPGWEVYGLRGGRDEREAMVAEFIPARGHIVRFGGYDRYAQISGGTYELIGDHWERVATLHSPASRVRAAAAYDSGRQRWVMWGGFSQFGGNRADTWEFDGTDWTEIPISGPPPMERASMAYDPIGHRVVLHCRCGANTTWAYDGVSWQPVVGTASSPPRWMSAMTYDPINQRIVMFGGYSLITGLNLNDTWILVGNDWTQLTPAISPPKRNWHTLAYDPVRQAVLLNGGILSGVTSDTWMLVGSTWSELTGTTAAEIIEASMTFDPTRGHMIRYGGWAGRPVDLSWELFDDGWRRIGALTPSDRTGSAFTTDTKRDRMLVFGGEDYWEGDQNDLWQFDGVVWSPVITATRPPISSYISMAYDSVRDRVVLVAENRTTWELYDGDWHEVTTATQAPGRGGMAYDPDRELVVSFSNVTMEYDGVDWRAVPLGLQPPVTGDLYALAYDPTRHILVAFGGGRGESRTWEYDGTSWTGTDLVPSPAPREQTAMVYDPLRKRLALFAGETGFGPINDSWEYDGVWHFLDTTDAYLSRMGPAVAFLKSFGGIVMFGGNDEEWTLHDTWAYRWR